MYAIIKLGGKQTRVEEGKFIKTEKLPGEKGTQVEFDEILLIKNDNTFVGRPYVDGAKVIGKIIEQGRDNKVTVFKYKAKKGYRRKQGHRQAYSKVLIEKIEVPVADNA